jgi:hypothetical protein
MALHLAGNLAEIPSELRRRVHIDTDMVTAYLNSKADKIARKSNLPSTPVIFITPKILQEELHKGKPDIVVTSFGCFMVADDIMVQDTAALPEQFVKIMELTADGNLQSNRVDGNIMRHLVDRYSYEPKKLRNMLDNPGLAVSKGLGYKVPKPVLETLLNECSPRLNRLSDGHKYLTYYINPMYVFQEMLACRDDDGSIAYPKVEILHTRRKTSDGKSLEYIIDYTNGIGVSGATGELIYMDNSKLNIDLEEAAKLVQG